MDTIIANNISNIAISTKMVIFGKDGTNIKIDISKMFRGDDAYIDITEISKSYGKKFKVWQRSKEVQAYIQRLEEFLKGQNCDPLNKPHKKGTHQDNTKAKIVSPLIKRKAGRYGGTYLHKKLALKYFRWLDMDFEIEVDLFLEKVYRQVTVVKTSRVETKLKFRPLTDAIRDIFIPAQTNENYKEYAYQMFMDLINIKVIGMRAWEFREKHNIPKSKNIFTRDYFPQSTLDNVIRFQQHLHSLLLAGITDFNLLSTMINNMPL